MRLELDLAQTYATAYGSAAELSSLRALLTERLTRIWGVPDTALEILLDPAPELCSGLNVPASHRMDILGGIVQLALREWIGPPERGALSALSPLQHFCAPDAGSGDEDARPVAPAAFLAQATGVLVQERILWPHQVAAALALLQAPGGRGIASVATGGGKTRICACIITLGALLGAMPWVYVAPNAELVEQAGRDIRKQSRLMQSALIRAGLVAERHIIEVDLECLTFTELSRRDSTGCCWGSDMAGLIVDEAHTVGAFRRAVAVLDTSALWRLGLSGTPLDRQDWKNALVVGALGPVVYTVSVHDLQLAGCLSPGTVRTV
jgi:hypothetical protein